MQALVVLREPRDAIVHDLDARPAAPRHLDARADVEAGDAAPVAAHVQN